MTLFQLRFGLFGPPAPRGLGNLFQTLFATSGPKDPNDPCSGPKFSQIEENYFRNALFSKCLSGMGMLWFGRDSQWWMLGFSAKDTDSIETVRARRVVVASEAEHLPRSPETKQMKPQRSGAPPLNLAVALPATKIHHLRETTELNRKRGRQTGVQRLSPHRR